MKVKATQPGFFDNIRRHEGDVFSIPEQPRRTLSKKEIEANPYVKEVMDGKQSVPQAFSYRWMRQVGRNVPEKTSTAQDQINRKHDEEIRARMGAGDAGIGDEAESADTGGDVGGEDSGGGDDSVI